MAVRVYQGYKKYTEIELKQLLESNENTNTLTDAEKSFLEDLIAQGGTGVTSFNGRGGAVVPQAGDYTKALVGLANVDNTSDLNKPISTATQNALNTKAASTDLTTAIGNLNKSSVGLANVDNTSDIAKPISTATQTALNLKANITDVNSQISGLTKAAVGLGNVDNTSDAAKPISTATQTALNTKAARQTISNAGIFTRPSITVTSEGTISLVSQNSSSGALRLDGLKLMEQLQGRMAAGLETIIAGFGDSTTLGVGVAAVDNDLDSEPRAIPVLIGHPSFPQYSQIPDPAYLGHGDAHPYLNTYPEYLQRVLQAKFGTHVKTKNCGYAGQSMANGWARTFLGRAVLDIYNTGANANNLKAIIFNFGLNDMLPNTNQADNYITEMNLIIIQCLDLGILPIFLGADRIFRNQGGNNTGTGVSYDGSYYAHELKGRARDLCAAYNVPFLDMEALQDHWLMTNEDGATLARVQNGGVHYNRIGYAYKASLVARLLIPNLATHTQNVTDIDAKSAVTNYSIGYASETQGNTFLLPDTSTQTGVTEAELTWDTTVSRHINFINFPASAYTGGQALNDIWLWNDRPSTLFLLNFGTTVTNTFNPTTDIYPLVQVFANHDYVNPINTRQRVGASGSTARLRESCDRFQRIITLPMGLIRIRLIAPATPQTFFYNPHYQINSLYPRPTRRLTSGGASAQMGIQTNAIAGAEGVYIDYTTGSVTNGAAWLEERPDLFNMVNASTEGDEVHLRIKTKPNFPIGYAVPLTCGRFKQNNSSLAPNQNGYGAALLRKNATDVELIDFATGGLTEYSLLVGALPSLAVDGSIDCTVIIRRTAPNVLSRQQFISVCAGDSTTPITLNTTPAWSANTVLAAGSVIHQAAPVGGALTRYWTPAGLTTGATWDVTEAARFTSLGAAPSVMTFERMPSANNRFMCWDGLTGGLVAPAPAANTTVRVGYDILTVNHKTAL